MNYSLSEVEATANKAARAAGYPWGLAAEAARSVRWLCQQGIDGCASLARHLETVDNHCLDSLSPVIRGRLWSAHNGCLCPVMSGTALSDRASTLNDRGIRLQRVAEPALLLFFAASIARQSNKTGNTAIVGIAWRGCQFATDGTRMSITRIINEGANELADIPTVAYADEVIIEYAEALESLEPLSNRATPAPSAWQTLNDFAYRTYAPATEESRLKGAGAGVSDND